MYSMHDKLWLISCAPEYADHNTGTANPSLSCCSFLFHAEQCLFQVIRFTGNALSFTQDIVSPPLKPALKLVRFQTFMGVQEKNSHVLGEHYFLYILPKF